MKKTTLIIVTILAISWQVKAQENARNGREFTRYRWDVSTDLLWLINKNTIPPSVFVRLNTEKNGRLMAYRFRLGGQYSEHLNPIDTISSTGTETDLRAFVSIGKEWQKQYNQLQLFYGTDLFFDYRLFQIEAVQDEKGWLPRHRDISLGLSPFVGMRYFIHPRISFSTEAHVNAYFHQSYLKVLLGGLTDPENPDPIFGTLRLNYFRLNISPIYIINFTYHF